MHQTGFRLGSLYEPPGHTAGRPEARLVILYGATVAAAAVNGTDLPRLDPDSDAEGACGWWHDGARSVIRLPCGLSHELKVVTT